MRVLELFSGYGSQALALENLGIEFTSDISEIDKYAIQAYNQLHGETHNWGDITKIDETKLPYYDLITYSSPCFTADSLVLTETNGYKKITDVEVGESVLTHDGSYKSVEKVINNGVKSTVKIYGMGFDEIHTTENHKFYVREKTRIWNNSKRSYKRVFSKPKWKEIKDLTKGDYLGFPVNKKSIVPTWNGITFSWSDGRSDRHKNQLSEYMDNYNFWWVIGRYVADGYFRTNGGIIITCGKKKIDELKCITDKLDINYSIQEGRTAYKLSYSLKELESFVKPFGRYAHGKKIPSFVIDLPYDLLKGFLDGYMAGDGCFTNNKFKATSVSRELVYGLAQCVAKVYKRPFSIYKTTRPITKVIENRIVNQKDTYELNFRKENHLQDKAFYENGFIWFPFNKKEKAAEEVVYDLTIKDNHSFVVNNAIVHNCQDFSVAGLGKGGDMGSGTRSSLLWECERIIRAVKPKYLLMENVKNLVGEKHKHNFIRWLHILEMMGYQNFWKVLNAKDYGVPQNRERVFVISILGCGQYLFPNPIKLEKRLKDVLERKVDEKYYLSDKLIKGFLRKAADENDTFGKNGINIRDENGTASCLTARMHKMGISDNYIEEPIALDEQNKCIRTDGTVGTITTDGSSPKHNNRVIEPTVQQVGNIIETDRFGGNPNSGRIYSDKGISPCLSTMQGGGLEPKIIEDFYKGRDAREYENESPTIRSERIGLKVKQGYRIRKLTPRECWRLMGVKDEQYDKLHDLSNTQLYKLAGNSIVVDVLMGIFKNLLLSDEGTKGQLRLF